MNNMCDNCQNEVCKSYGSTCRKYRIKRMFTDNIERKLCLIAALVFSVLSLVTVSCFSFGFMTGIGLAGWMLLPDRSGKEK